MERSTANEIIEENSKLCNALPLHRDSECGDCEAHVFLRGTTPALNLGHDHPPTTLPIDSPPPPSEN